jgi:3-oxoacyl-(acyl-carrier-protein) synthase
VSRALITARWSGTPARESMTAVARSLVARPERLDDLCLAGLVAAHHLLAAAELTPETVAQRPHALVSGSALGCLETDVDYYAQIIDVGLERANPRLFAYTLANMVLGEVAIAHGWMGDQLAISAGRASGVAALAEGAGLVAGGEVDLVVVLALDVVGPTATRVFQAIGTHPLPRMSAFIVESPRSARARGAAPLATIDGGYGFDPDAETAWPDPDPLGAAALDGVFGALDRGGSPASRHEARCTSGHRAWLEVGPA